MVVAVVKLLMGKNYTPHIVLQLAARACACCGIRWDGQVVNGQHVKETAAWEGAGLAVCRACLGRLRRYLQDGGEPTERGERVAYYAWLGWEAKRRNSGIVAGGDCRIQRLYR